MRVGAPAHRELTEDGGGGRPGPLTLRVSVLDRCQYACPYCRPGAIDPFFGREELLCGSAYARLAPAFVRAGVTKVRFTGGEPLLRPDLASIVAAFRAASPTLDLALTTNGQLLPRRLGALVDAGLDRATVHVDSLRPDRYRALMSDADVGAVLDGALTAASALREVKINTVVQRGKNDDELLDFLALSACHGVEVRFIELMNTGSAVDYTREVFVSGREIVESIRRARGATAVPRRHAADPAALYRTDDGLVFGVIASDTESFCASCNRLRLTADGDLRGCLYQDRGVDLRRAAASGDASAIDDAIRAATLSKRSFHPSVAPRRLLFSMARTGG